MGLLAPEHLVYQDDQYVCLMRLFPTCRHEEPPQPGSFRLFHLRFYIPRELLLDAKKKADRVVIMINGLNEVAHYHLYDELGARLAARGVMAVLLPLPDHLNRHPRYRKAEPTAAQLCESPSTTLMKEPNMLFARYEQFGQELRCLLDHLKGRDCKDQTGACEFYRELISPNARVSLLGYSLGAAMALCSFLNNVDEWNLCFLLNGAINLRDINPGKMFDKNAWQNFVGELTEDCRKRLTTGASTDRLFDEVFLGQFIGETPKRLREQSQRVLFLFGGRDEMIGYESLERISPELWGLGMIVIPGINHFLAIDEEWKRWIDLVVDLIVSYEKNATRSVITKEAASQTASGSRQGPRPAPDPGVDARGIRLRARLIGWDPEQLAKDADARARMKERIDRLPFKKLRIGEMLVATKLASPRQIEQAIELKTNHPQSKGRLLGEILVAMGAVRMADIHALVAIQESPDQDRG
jgi:hypothetical protein